MLSFEDVEDIKRNIQYSLTSYLKIIFRSALTNGKLAGINNLNVKGTILKKINISFIVYFNKRNKNASQYRFAYLDSAKDG